MLLSTLPHVDNRPVAKTIGLVSAESIMGASTTKDFWASFTEWKGPKSPINDRVMAEAKQEAMDKVIAAAEAQGANAILGVDIDYHELTHPTLGGLIMVAVSGTAVVLGP